MGFQVEIASADIKKIRDVDIEDLLGRDSIALDNTQIAEDIKDFVFKGQGQKIRFDNSIQFYGYYSDYDWVVFCWLFGKMIDLPIGFPMYCIDLKQVLDEKALRWCGNIRQMSSIFCDDFKSKLDSIKSCKDYPKQTNEHNALADAKWNFELYKFLNTL